MPASLQVELLREVGLAAARGNTVAEIAQPTTEALIRRFPQVSLAFIYVPSSDINLLAGIASKDLLQHQRALKDPTGSIQTVDQLIQDARIFKGRLVRPLDYSTTDDQPENLGFIHIYGPEELDKAHITAVDSILSIVSTGIARAKNRIVEDEATRLRVAQELARTTAHEVNNALAPIVGFTELLGLLPSIVGDIKAQAYLRAIIKGAEGAAGVVQRLATLARLDRRQSPVGPTINLTTSHQPPSEN